MADRVLLQPLLNETKVSKHSSHKQKQSLLSLNFVSFCAILLIFNLKEFDVRKFNGLVPLDWEIANTPRHSIYQFREGA